jgi:PAS domain S-box-containing protein
MKSERNLPDPMMLREQAEQALRIASEEIEKFKQHELRHEVKLREQAEARVRFQANLLSQVNDAIIALDKSLRITYWNDAAERLYKLTASEMLGQSLEAAYYRFQLFKAEEREDVFDSLARTGAWHGQSTLVRDGDEFHVELSMTPLRDEGGAAIGFLAVARDVTERKQAEAALAQHAAELARSNAELEQFAYVASHDLQEPLRMVTLYTQLLEKRYKGKLDADADEFIDYAVDGAKRMHQLINDLLAYSRVSSHGKEFELTDCEAVLKRSLTNLRTAVEESRAEVTHDALPTLMADGLQLVMLFQNLLSNALKFQGEAPPRVHVSAAPNGKKWLFSVRDNGIGVDPDCAERIFIIFQRLHSMKDYPGTGIGLAICKKIVQRHGGRIWVESEPGKGATFYFTLPMRPGRAKASSHPSDRRMSKRF